MPARRTTSSAEPLGLWIGEGPTPPAYPELRCIAFELSSRGDRVPGRLLLPERGEGPFPVVLLQHGAGGSSSADYLDATGGPWARRGVAVASIDFPLHGERGDAKLAGPLLQAVASRRFEGWTARLLRDVFAQAVHDLRRTTDALEAMPWVDASRLAYAAFSLGTLIGASFCAADPRPRAAAFAVGGAGIGPLGAEVTDALAGIAPRPVLFVNTRGDQTFPPESAQAFYDAAAEPKELLWFEGSHRELPGAALKAMWQFLAQAVELDPASAGGSSGR